MHSPLRPSPWKIVFTGLAVALLATTAAHAEKTKSKTPLVATGILPKARGIARVIVRTPTKGSFRVRASSLGSDSSYDVLVGGIKVTTLLTDADGEARVRFSTRKAGENLVLGFDPRGEAVEVRDASGANVLVGNIAAPAASETDTACCVPDDSGTECEDRTPAECLERGGTPSAAGSCFPDPCGSAPPPKADVVCCIPDDSGPECEDRTQAECLAAGGSLVQADSCVGDPCNATPPSPDDSIQCCVPAYYVWDCEDRTVAECQLLGGFNKGPGQCSPNPCGDLPPSDGHGVCCQPNAKGDEIECEDRTASDCLAAGGVVKSASGVCEVDTCADVLPPNPDVMCCTPNLAGDEIECEDRSAAACAAEGGVDKGPGVCGIDTCADVIPNEPDVICCVPGGGNDELRCEDRTLARCIADGGTSLGEGSCPDVDPCVADGGGKGGKN